MKKAVWPPGFVSQITVDTSARKKAEAASKARTERIRKGGKGPKELVRRKS